MQRIHQLAGYCTRGRLLNLAQPQVKRLIYPSEQLAAAHEVGVLGVGHFCAGNLMAVQEGVRCGPKVMIMGCKHT